MMDAAELTDLLGTHNDQMQMWNTIVQNAAQDRFNEQLSPEERELNNTICSVNNLLSVNVVATRFIISWLMQATELTEEQIMSRVIHVVAQELSGPDENGVVH